VGVTLDSDACYRALVARDSRFDGLFFVGVTTTGIYCRPVCRARTPGRSRCVFFRRGAEAERDGYRACFRCRPELAPGRSSVDAVSRHVAAAVTRIEEGALNEGSVDTLAEELGVTARHLRRAFDTELGISPVELAQSRRLAFAKALLQDGRGSVTEVAFASGFSSVRRFNASFRERFGRAPSSLRRETAAAVPAPLGIRLSYRQPFAASALFGFLRGRATRGIEVVTDDTYSRTVRLGNAVGCVVARHDPATGSILLETSASLAGSLMTLAARIRRVFDLDAEPAVVDAHLALDASLRARVRRAPGLRVPGAFDPFEVAVRAVLGQQISVAAATTLAGRLVERFGDPIETPVAGLDRLFPPPARLAAASEPGLASIGLPAARARTLQSLASHVADGRITFGAGTDPDQLMRSMIEVPGIGPWTASYVAMRGLGAPDAFPEGDLGLCRALDLRPAALRERAERWRPWRAYAALHLWNDTSGG
jgi:AraC family transcriptional regulator, regulatory protein of adaptative response / DNA-3-methyladenine glycosylase II